MVIGLDMEYNPSPTKAIAVDIYPIKLPDIIDIALRDSGDESAIDRVKSMLSNRAVLIHIEVNKLATAFDGYLKD